MTRAIGIGAAAGAAIALNGSYLIQHGGLGRVAPLAARRPVASLGALLRSRRWLAGAALGYAGLALNLVALGFAPISLVQSIVAGGLVVVGIGAGRVSGRRASGSEALALALVVAGIVLLVSTGSPAHGPRPRVPVAFWLFALAACAACAPLVHRGASRHLRGPGIAALRLALAGGILYGASYVAFTVTIGIMRAGGARVGAAVALAVAVGLSAAGFWAFQRALQLGQPAPVVTVMTAATNVVAVIGGLTVLGDGLGRTPAVAVLHVAAFALIPLGAGVAGGLVRIPPKSLRWARRSRASARRTARSLRRLRSG